MERGPHVLSPAPNGEWLDALAEASSFMDVGCVDEGLDLSNDFGI